MTAFISLPTWRTDAMQHVRVADIQGVAPAAVETHSTLTMRGGATVEVFRMTAADVVARIAAHELQS